MLHKLFCGQSSDPNIYGASRVWHGALSKTETRRIMGLLVSNLTKEKKRKKASSGSKERPPKA